MISTRHFLFEIYAVFEKLVEYDKSIYLIPKSKLV